MPADRDTRSSAGKGVPTLASELWQLVVTYLRQETVVPVKGLARFVALGLAGSAVLSLGLLLLVIALLRALQTETDTSFSGNLSWAPYAITLSVSALIAATAARAIGRHKRRARRKGTMS